jgi:hypothetical protein
VGELGQLGELNVVDRIKPWENKSRKASAQVEGRDRGTKLGMKLRLQVVGSRAICTLGGLEAST